MKSVYTQISVVIMLLQSMTVSAAEYQNASSGMGFSWLDSDYISVYTTDGTLIKYYPSSISGNNATLQSGFGLADNTQYFAYTPYNKDNWDKSITSLSVSYLNQYQQGNGNTTHLSAYDYQTASFTTGTGSFNISFSHVGAVLHFCWTMPVMAKPIRLTLACQDGNPFTTDATLDLTTQTLTTVGMADTLSLAMKMVTQSYMAVVETYLMTPPIDLTDKMLTATLYTASGDSLVAKIKGTNVLPGHIYPIVIGTSSTTINSNGSNNSCAKMMSNAFSDSETPSVTSVTSLTAYSPDFTIDEENVFNVQQSTGINNVCVSYNKQSRVFNIAGQRIMTPMPGGVNIINGKKIVKR